MTTTITFNIAMPLLAKPAHGRDSCYFSNIEVVDHVNIDYFDAQRTDVVEITAVLSGPLKLHERFMEYIAKGRALRYVREEFPGCDLCFDFIVEG